MAPEVRVAINRVAAATGRSVQSVYGELRRRFQVARTDDVPVDDALRWVRERQAESDAAFRADSERWAFFMQFCEEHAEDDSEKS